MLTFLNNEYYLQIIAISKVQLCLYSPHVEEIIDFKFVIVTKMSRTQ